MPFQSKAQRRKFYALKAKGQMDQKTIDEWESHTPNKLPERKKTAHYHAGTSAALMKLGLDANLFSDYAQRDASKLDKDNDICALDDDAHARNNDKLINPPSPWTGAFTVTDSGYPDI